MDNPQFEGKPPSAHGEGTDVLTFTPASDPETISQGLQEGWITTTVEAEVVQFPPQEFSPIGETAKVFKPLAPSEARTLCEEIKGHLRSARQLLLALYEGEGWKALGYKSWRECITTEFEQSQRHCYHLLAAAQVGRNLCTIVQNPDDIPESHLRPLAQLEPEYQVQAYQQALEAAGDRVTAKHVERAVAKLLKTPAERSLSNENSHDQHLTPPPIKTLLMGFFEQGIDVDPCCNEGEPNIEARQHYRMADDGLRPQWHGTVFINPPYSGKHGSKMEDWTLKLRREYEAGRTTEAIALVPNYSAEGWYLHLDSYPLCSIRGRVTFADADGKPQPSAARFASALFYLGPRYDRFKQFFGGLGRIWKPDLED